MEIAYDHLFWLLSQCFFVGVLLLVLFRLRTFFGLGLLYITLGVFQFLQAFTASAFSIDIGSNMTVSSGSMVLFTGSLFAVLIIYIREDAIEARKVIYGLIVANLSLALIMFLFVMGVDIFQVNNHFNLPEELFIQNSIVLFFGTIILLLDTFAIIFIYEYISKYIPILFLRILFTMTLVVILDTFLFSIVISGGGENFQNDLIAGIFSKSSSVLVYSGLFTLYLTYFDKKLDQNYSKADSYEDIFNKLTFRQKYQDVIQEMKIKTNELQESQKVARLGSYSLDISSGIWQSSDVLDEIFSIDQKFTRDVSGWVQIIDPRDQDMMQEYLFVNILTNHEKFNKEYRVLNQEDDEIIWVHGIGDLVYDQKGNLVKMIGTIQDITERKKAELELIDSENKFSTVFHKNPNPQHITSIPDGKFVDVNPVFEEISGYTREELIGKTAIELGFYVKNEDREKMFEELRNKGSLKGYDIRFKTRNGVSRDCLVYSEIIDINKEPCLISIVRDVSEQKKAEQELIDQNYELTTLGKKISEQNKLLKESRRKFKKLFDKNPVSLWEEDFSEVRKMLDKKKADTTDLKKYLNENPDFVFECISKIEIINVNDITLKLLGVKNKKELLSQLGNTFNESSFKVFKKELLAIAKNKKEFSAETEFIRSDNEIISALIKFVILDDIKDRAIISIVDITELTKAKKEIEKSEKQFRELYEKSGDAILIIKNGKFVECNQATVDMLEYETKENFLNSHPSKLSPIFQQDGQKSFDKADDMMNIAVKKGTHRFEWTHSKKGGENFPVEVLLTVISKEPENEVIHTVWRDITDRKAAEFILKESEGELRKSQEIAQLGTFNLNFKTQLFTSSPIFDSIVGLTPEFTKKFSTYQSIVHPEDFDENQKILANCIKTGKRFDREYRIFPKNSNELKWVHALGEIFYKESEPLYFRGTIQDITRRKLVELEVKLNEQKLIEIQKIANLGTYEINLLNNHVTASPIYKSILGINKTPKNNKGWWKSITHPEDFERSELLWKECLKACKVYEDEYRVVTDKKEVKWIHDIAEVQCEKGVATKVVGTIQDISVRKNAEIKLIENQLRLKEAQKVSKLGSFIFEDSTKLFESTAIFDEIVDIRPSYKKDLKGWINLIYPEDILIVRELLDSSGLESISKEFRIVKNKSKEIIWVKGMAKVQYDENGIRQKVIGTLQDITERKISEEKIKRSDAVINQIESLIKVTDNKGNITYASPSFKTVLGYEPKEMLGQGWWIKSTPNLKTAMEIRDSVLGEVNNKKSLTDRLRYRWIKTKEGKNKLFQWTSTKGLEDSLIFIGIDITEKQEKETQFKTLTETAHDSIILVDHDGLIFEWNKSSQETFGYTKEEINGKPLTSLMPEKYRSQYKNGFDKVMQKALKTKYRNQIVEGLTKEGVVFPMELSINYWKSENRYVYCYFIRDITQRQREELIKEVIFDINKKASETLGIREFSKFVKSELGKLINTDNFFIAIYNDKTGMINTPFMVDELDDMTDFPKGETLTGHVIDTKKAILTKEKVLRDSIHDKSVIGLGPESKCWLGVPLLVDNKVVGAMVVQSYTDENAYSQDDVALFELVASNIGHIIKKTEDLEQIRLLNKALIQSPQAVIITNTKGEIEYTNPAFTNLSGYAASEALGRKPSILRSDVQSADFYKNLWETIGQGKIWEGEFVNKRKDGSKYLVEANISSVKNSAGNVTHYIGIQEDVTEKRKLQRQFINAFIEAQEIEKQAFGEELHDGISQILSAEAMYIDLLIEQNKDRIHDKAKFLTKIKELNMSAVNETRTIAHGLMSSQLKQSGLLISVENICLDFNSTKKIKFNFKNKDVKEEELSKEIKTNLFRIIQELTTNINRYSLARKASIAFRKLDSGKIRLKVKDDGKGMDYEKILEQGKVTGLQNVVRRITFLNGSFEIESKPNKGTSWEIIVPL